MYVKIHERDENDLNRQDHLLIECTTYKVEYVKHHDIHEGYSFYVGKPPEQPGEVIVLRTWDRAGQYQDVLIYAPASGYVTNEDGKTVERFSLAARPPLA